MSAEEILKGVEWKEVAGNSDAADGIPYATHEGVVEFFGKKIRCYRLNDGRAVVNADDLNAAMADIGLVEFN